VTNQSRCLASAAVLPVREAQRSADANERVQTMIAELGPRLSSGALIYFSGSEEFDTLTERWQLYAPPTFVAVVVANTEQDVQFTVSFHHVELA
jgi:hypothetical protein